MNIRTIRPLDWIIAIIILVPCLVWIGWTMDNPYLIRVLPSLTPMNPVSGICFVLSAFCLTGLVHRMSKTYRSLMLLAGGILLFVGLSMLMYYLFKIDVHVDRIFFNQKLGATRMAPNTGTNFALIGLAILTFDRKIRGFVVADLAILLAIILAMLALVGYYYNLVNLYGLPTYIPMALHVAVLFVLLGLSLLFARNGNGLVALFLPGGALNVWFYSLRLRSKLLLVFGTIIAFLMFFSIVVLSNLSSLRSQQLPAQDGIRSAYAALLQMRLDQQLYLVNADDANIADFEIQYARFVRSMATYISFIPDDSGGATKAIQQVRAYHGSFLQMAGLSTQSAGNSLIAVDTNVQEAASVLSKLQPNIVTRTDDKISLLYRLVISLSVFLSLLSALFALLVSRLISESLSSLEQAAKSLAKGKKPAKLRIISNDEVGTVSMAFNRMAAALSISQAKLEIGNLQLRSNVSELEKSKMAAMNILEDLKRSTQRIEEERAKDEAILASISDGVFVVDKELRIVLFNQSASDISGFSKVEAIGKPYDEILSFVHAETGQPEVGFVRYSLEKGTVQEMLDNIELICKCGEKVSVANSAAPVFDGAGKISGCVVVFRDVTRERAIDQAKTEFVSLASHQLRTPLSAINWYSEMLLAGDAGPITEEQRIYLQEVYHGNQRMVELVNALLNVSRIDLGTFSVDPVPTMITEVADSVLSELKPQIVGRRQHIDIEYDEQIPIMQLDPKLIRIILQNLLSNSIKYTPEKGKIRLGIMLDGKHHILITVADTGYGIPHAQKDKIFSKLFRADNVTDKDTEGTGLGLYIVKSIVKTNGGEISFKSSENKGTTFSVTLPLKGMQKKEGNKGLN